MQDELSQDDKIEMYLAEVNPDDEEIICELCKKEVAKINLAKHWIEECEKFHEVIS